MAWLTEFRCAKCSTVLNTHIRMYSNGRCPYCGHKGKHAGTIIDCTEHAYRLISRGKWWQFWLKPVREYK